MKKYEVTLQLLSSTVTVEVEVFEGATERDIEFAADAQVQKELNLSKIDSFREIKDPS